MDKARGIQVGQGGTYTCGSDRYPVTVIEVNGNTVVVQHDKYTYKGDEVTFSPDPKGEKQTVSLRKNGRYYQVGKSRKGPSVSFEHGRDQYTDPCR
jgi:hypothetical protein